MAPSKGHGTYILALILAAASMAVVATTFAFSRTPTVHANGFTVPIAEGVSGPYEYTVGIWPPNPGVGELHMAIVVTANKQIVTNAGVSVRGAVVGGTETVGPVAGSGWFLPWVYELNLHLGQPGDWMFEIEIDSPLGKTVVEASLEVSGDQAPVEQATEEPGASATLTPPPTPTATPTETPTLLATAPVTPGPTPTAMPTPTATAPPPPEATVTPTASPEATATPTPTGEGGCFARGRGIETIDGGWLLLGIGFMALVFAGRRRWMT